MKGDRNMNSMSLWGFLRGRRQAADRKTEVQYRLQLAELRRQAERMKRDTQQTRKEAFKLESEGRHNEALSKASVAVHQENAYQRAFQTMLRCETMHAQAKTQKALTDLMNGCKDISAAVMKQVDTESALKAQAHLEKTSMAMEQVQENMLVFQEGFEPDVPSGERLAAGEEALAAIMLEHAPVPVQPDESVGMQAEPARAEAGAQDRSEWLVQRRQQLSELV